MLRLQQVTFMALHNFLGLSYELIASVSIFNSTLRAEATFSWYDLAREK